MPIVYLNKRQKAELVGRLAKVKGAARSVKQLREVLNFKELEELQDKNQEILENLVAKGELNSVNVNISKKLASEYGITLMGWNEVPGPVEIDKSLLEVVINKMPKEEELDGGDWTVLELKEELDRAWEDAKSNSKKVVEKVKEDKQETTNA